MMQRIDTDTYWQQKLAGAPPALALPFDYPRPPVSSYIRSVASIQIRDEVRSRVISVSDDRNEPSSMILFAALQAVLMRYTGQDDLVMWCLSDTNEAREDSPKLLPWRLSLDESWTGLDIINATSELAAEIAKHESVSDRTIDEFVRPDQQSESPINAAFVASRRSRDQARDAEEFLNQCSVVFFVEGSDSELQLCCDYDSELFSDETITRMLGHVQTLLGNMLTVSEATISHLPMLTDAECEHLSNRHAPTSNFPVENCLHETFEAQAERTPNAIAITCDDSRLNYDQLNRKANRLANRLREYGVGPNVLVGLYMERSNDLVIGILAILKAGGAYLPIDLSYPSERVDFMLADSKAVLLLTHSELHSELPKSDIRFVDIDKELTGSSPATEANLGPLVSTSDLAYVIYTSGTTGKPKGALVTHRNVGRLFTATHEWFRFNEQDVWTMFHSSAFDFSVWELWGALLYGGRLVVVPYSISRSPDSYYELLEREKVTVLNQTPSAFRQLIRVEETGGQRTLSLRYVIFGGEALEMESLRPWFERHGDQQPQLVNMYGITETTVHVTYRPLSRRDVGGGSVIGVPIPDLQIHILEPNGQPAPIGVPGEMFVAGAGVCDGYLHRDELTAERFLEDNFAGDGGRLYRTGDQARRLAGGDIEYMGRIDHQVKIRGFRIELSEIETVLAGHESVHECIVIAREDTPGDKRLTAYVVRSDQPTDGSVSELRRHLKTRLPEYMVPASFVFLNQFTLTNNGKVDRKALPAPDEQRPELADSYVAPRTPIEKHLAAIWSDVLRIEKVGIHDNYFELGGDSIQSTLVVSAARKVGLQLTPKQLFEYPTIAQLASVAVERIDSVVSQQGPIEGDSPLTPIQRWFFEQRLADPHYYNQAFLFELRESLDVKAFGRAMAAIELHHDVLRLRFRLEGDDWHQSFAAPDSAGKSTAQLQQVDFSTVSDADVASEITRVAVECQSSLDLQDGPLWRVVMVKLAGGASRLLVVIHHMAIDGVSWRILLEDLEQGYRQSQNGDEISFASKTTSFKSWAERLEHYAGSDELTSQRLHWKQLAAFENPPILRADSNLQNAKAANTEATAETITVRLTEAETEDLLQRVPRAYNTMINDVLLTALAQSVESSTGHRNVLINLEGHGREDIFEDVDLTRTLGWFTTIYPVNLALPDSALPQDALKSVKEQLRTVPQRGIGYGILRYLSEMSSMPEPSLRCDPELVFNYFGKFDDVVRDSKLFGFADQNTGPWHSPRQQRRHALEVNCMTIGGRLEAQWTFSSALHRRDTIETTADAFLQSLRSLIGHCVSTESSGYTPSDFPLCGLDQSSLDRLVDGSSDIEDVYPPSPIQLLFLARAASQSGAILDHWQCTLSGNLDVQAFQQSWQDVFDCHPVLRTSFQSEGLREPLQVVHRRVTSPWTIEDWSGRPIDEQQELWEQLLREDRAVGMELDQAPLSRFTLVRIDEDTHRFLWSVPALLLDGWSWPLVFADVSRAYEWRLQNENVVLEKPRTYREYLGWLHDHAKSFDQNIVGSDGESDASQHEFWRSNLAGMTVPTPLLSESPTAAEFDPTNDSDTFGRISWKLSGETIAQLQRTIRARRTTVGALVQAAWTIVLSRLSNSHDVTFGAAFSGRPTDLAGAEAMVGPFVNNLPVRVKMSGNESLGDLLTASHDRLLRLNPYQFVPSAQIQQWSDVPWQHRLFDSLVVVQNYVVHESARRMGPDVSIDDFEGPIHTNYPLLVLVEPDASWRISMIYDRQVIAPAAIERWKGDLIEVLHRIAGDLDAGVDAVLQDLSPPVKAEHAHQKLFVQSQNHVPPRTPMEKEIARVWKEVIRLDRVSIEDNLFDLGVQSLLVVQLHQKLQDELDKQIGLVALFRYPTILALARHLDSDGQDSDRLSKIEDRGKKQRGAMASMKKARARIKR